MKLLDQTLKTIKPQDPADRARARARLERLIMPPWALGRLLDLALDLAGMTGTLQPAVGRKTIVTLAADHGVTAEGVSKFPREVTTQMVRNFVQGGAGVTILAGLAGAKVVVVDMGVAGDLGDLAASGRILSKRIAPGTRNLAQEPAMSREEAARSLEAGIEITRDLDGETDVFGTGDMGIGNTTPSAAIAAVLTGQTPERVTGRGTGIDDAMLAHKISVIRRALEANRPDPRDGLDVLAKIGGFEIGGIAGVILGAAARRKPVVVDGFISTAGALIAQSLCPASADYMIAAHRSVEPGHAAMQRQLGKEPLLDLNLRLGEGTGAALAMNLVEAAARILTDMATFEEASVSGATA